jgi:hypothetical protein
MAAKNNRLDRILSGTDAQMPEYILKMFETIKGRPPTAKEIARLLPKNRTFRNLKP